MRYLYEKTDFLDERCYEAYALSPEILMEHAGLALAKAIKKNATKKEKILFICGPGNNGADGLVAARLLHGKYAVSLYLPMELKSPLAKLNYDRALKLGITSVDTLCDADVYVDALFGAGMNRPLDANMSELIQTLNEKKGYKIACDVPSGLTNDTSLIKTLFRADETITMGGLKLGLFHDGLKDSVGKITIASLGIHHSFYDTESPYLLLEEKDLLLPYRKKQNTNKGTFGHVAVIQGNKKGAALLAGKSAFHFGAGLVTLVSHTPSTLPSYLMQAPSLPKGANVIVAGMGLELPDEAFLQTVLLENTLPLVIDASLFSHQFIEKLLSSNKPMVLTPHPKEFTHLLKTTLNQTVSVETLQQNRFFYAKLFSEKFPHSVLVLKGANTIIAYQGTLYVNTLGTSALAKGGSGDVLAGMIGALIAQGYTLVNAAIHASLAHALVARKSRCNTFAFTPSDIYKGLKWL